MTVICPEETAGFRREYGNSTLPKRILVDSDLAR